MSRLYFEVNMCLKIKALGIEHVLFLRINNRDHDHEDSRILDIYCLKLVPSLKSLGKGVDDLNKIGMTSFTCMRYKVETS